MSNKVLIQEIKDQLESEGHDVNEYDALDVGDQGEIESHEE